MKRSIIFLLALGAIIIGVFFAAKRRERRALTPANPVTPAASSPAAPESVTPASEAQSQEPTFPPMPPRDALTTSLMQLALDFAERYGNSTLTESWFERFASYLVPELKAKLATAAPPRDQMVQAIAAKLTGANPASGRATLSVEVLRTTAGKTLPANLSVSLEKRGETWLVSSVNWK